MKHPKEGDDVPSRGRAALAAAAVVIAIFTLPAKPHAQAPKVELPQVEQPQVPEPAPQAVKASEAEVAVEEAQIVPRSRFDDQADFIIQCESSGRNIEIIDRNGEWSRGVAMFQDRTWAWMSKAAGVTGSPLEPAKARTVLIWALKNGIASEHWVICYAKLLKHEASIIQP